MHGLNVWIKVVKYTSAEPRRRGRVAMEPMKSNGHSPYFIFTGLLWRKSTHEGEGLHLPLSITPGAKYAHVLLTTQNAGPGSGSGSWSMLHGRWRQAAVLDPTKCNCLTVFVFDLHHPQAQPLPSNNKPPCLPPLKVFPPVPVTYIIFVLVPSFSSLLRSFCVCMIQILTSVWICCERTSTCTWSEGGGGSLVARNHEFQSKWAWRSKEN